MFVLGLLIDLVDVLRSIDARLANLETKTMSALDDLATQVTKNTDLEQSAITLIQGLASQIAAAAGDPAKISALSSQLSTSATALAAAITANTPSAPAPPAPAP